MGELWFKGFKRHSGFDRGLTVEENLKVMYLNAGLKKPADRWRRVGRQANVLANLTKDKPTERRARAVANAAFKKLAKLQE
jgi:hypothetical protein